MQEKPTQTPCPNLTCCAEDSPARLSALLAITEDLTTQEGPCSLSLPGWLKPGSLRICCLKMCPACSAITAAGHLQPSSIRWTDWGILWNGRCLTAKISVLPNPDAGCILSDILMPDAEEKYFLSPKQQERLLYKSKEAHRESASTLQTEQAAPWPPVQAALAATPGCTRWGCPSRKPPKKATKWRTPETASS